MKHVHVPLLSAELSPLLQKVKAQTAGSSQAVKFINKPYYHLGRLFSCKKYKLVVKIRRSFDNYFHLRLHTSVNSISAKGKTNQKKSIMTKFVVTF